ncbi:MAG: hypothetical protein ACHWZW_20225 [Spirulina sp.]
MPNTNQSAGSFPPEGLNNNEKSRLKTPQAIPAPIKTGVDSSDLEEEVDDWLNGDTPEATTQHQRPHRRRQQFGRQGHRWTPEL